MKRKSENINQKSSLKDQKELQRFMFECPHNTIQVIEVEKHYDTSTNVEKLPYRLCKVCGLAEEYGDYLILKNFSGCYLKPDDPKALWYERKITHEEALQHVNGHTTLCPID